MNSSVAHLFSTQLADWETARLNYEALAQVRVRELKVNGMTYKVQFNPARIRSSAAKVDERSIRERRCFLCPEHLPPQQRGLPFGGHYQILVNPFPIFPRHLTIPDMAHTPQRIATRFADMLQLAQALPGFTVFYNGPRCGASAPDHAHFQAGNRGFMPVEQEWRECPRKLLAACRTATLWWPDNGPRTLLVLESPSEQDAVRLFEAIYHSLTPPPGEEEPMLNLLACYEKEQWTVFLFPRSRHRPSCYEATGSERLLCSPASVDLGGVFILPVEADFLRIREADIERILQEVCLPPEAILPLKVQIPKYLSI